MKDEQSLILSLGIVALNEEPHLPSLLNDLKHQTYQHNLMEIVLVDSGSNDKTKEIMLDFKKNNEDDFYAIQVLDNPKKVQAAGWNVAISNFKGDSLTRIDAHSKIDADFCKYVFENLLNGEKVVGGKRPCIVESNSKWSNTLLQVENSLFGSSILKSRSSDAKQYVKTMFHATYRREVFEKVGFFNENLLRTEDNEFHYRVRQAGFRLCYDPRILSYQYARPSLKKMTKQKYGNGYWIGKTVKFCPNCLSLYHFIPFCFLLSIVVGVIASCIGFWYGLACLGTAYFLFAVINTIASGIKNRFHLFHIIMPFLFFILHVSYGIGTLFGLASINKF